MQRCAKGQRELQRRLQTAGLACSQVGFNLNCESYLADEHYNFQEIKKGEEDCDHDSDSNSSHGPTYANLEPLDPEGLQTMELDLRYFQQIQ